MKKTRFSETKIVSILKKQEAGITTADICRELGISKATFYNWKAKYGGLEWATNAFFVNVISILQMTPPKSKMMFFTAIISVKNVFARMGIFTRIFGLNPEIVLICDIK